MLGDVDWLRCGHSGKDVEYLFMSSGWNLRVEDELMHLDMALPSLWCVMAKQSDEVEFHKQEIFDQK